ncbi:hypothetical protein [Streptomyces sp. GESEQ-35]|uniref:hypothetical protein n=1 Tax=Streptomyces sp. GESEQ-35 TaxID=2812657 RepID=UPI001B3314A2|nr:hypothetical protein [Streptomyces sp. GESEQ-35]
MAIQKHIAAATSRSIAHLEEPQNSDGGWGHDGNSASDALSTAQAIPAITRYGAASRVITPTVSYLLAQPHPDGDFTAPPDQVPDATARTCPV